MKKILLTCLIINICSAITFAQYKLSIEIKNLQNNEGQIHLYVFDEDQNKIAEKTEGIEHNECTIIIDNLSSGQYAFKYFHDENNNDKVDCNWMKIPNEGYGFSNNARGKFGPPPFEQWLFEINDDKKIICVPTY
jgi:uncharacterized protein (DUF2141 family)